MAAAADPIGIFDSGVGGLSIAAAIHALLPAESLFYYADRAHFPYGTKSEEEVRRLAQEVAAGLIGEGAKLIVVACNTASSVALEALRASFPVLFVGVVPGIKPASTVSRTARVGVLATEATFHTKIFADLVGQFAEGVELHCQICPHLVSLVEAGEVASPRVKAQLRAPIASFLAKGVDTIVLGCTHYSFLSPVIRCMAGEGVTVIDTAVPVARQVVRVLEARDLLQQGEVPGRVRLSASRDLEGFLRVAAKLWPEGVRSAP